MNDSMMVGMELVLSILGAVAAGGWSVLHLITRHFDQRHEDLKALIAEQFSQSERHRQEASAYWRSLFETMKDQQDDIETRLDGLHARVGQIEADIHALQSILPKHPAP